MSTVRAMRSRGLATVAFGSALLGAAAAVLVIGEGRRTLRRRVELDRQPSPERVAA